MKLLLQIAFILIAKINIVYILMNQLLLHVVYLDGNVFVLEVMLTPLQELSYVLVFYIVTI